MPDATSFDIRTIVIVRRKFQALRWVKVGLNLTRFVCDWDVPCCALEQFQCLSEQAVEPLVDNASTALMAC